MKIVRFVKKLWADLLDESHELKSLVENFWRNILFCGIFFAICYAIGMIVRVIGLSKYFPLGQDGKEVGPFLHGVLTLVILIMALLFVLAIYTTVVKLKKTWKEV